MARQIILALLLLAYFTPSFAQNCNCLTDLDEVAKAVKKAPSYKDGVKEKGEVFFETALSQIKVSIVADPLKSKNCSAYIQQYLSLFNDQHLMLYPDYGQFKTQKDVFASALYQLTPSLDLDTNKLDFEMPIEGIYEDVYHYYKVALVKDVSTVGQYMGIILSSKSALWKANQVKFILKQWPDGKFDGFFYDDVHFAKYALISYANNKLNGVEWAKQVRFKTEIINPFKISTTKKWDYQKLDEETDYVYLGTFSGMLAYETDTFYRELIPKLKGKRLIIDVRNNGGGGERSYNLFLNYLNSAACTASQIAILQNTGCASACEHFILTLRKNPKVKSFGENTKGMLAYGYGNRSSITINTSCFNYIAEITEAKYPLFKVYEKEGIPPDVKLARDKDWIVQVKEQLTANK